MKLLRVLPVSLRAVAAHRTRSVLAAAGVAVGIAAVFLTSAIGRGAAAEMLRGLGGAARSLVVVRPVQVKRSAVHKELRGVVSSLKPDDWRAIQELEGVEAAAPIAESPAIKVKVDGRVVRTSVVGTTQAYFRIRRLGATRGELFADAEGTDRSRVAVLGGRIAAALFPNEDPIGQDVRVGGTPFVVIGTLERRGVAVDGSDIDNQVFVPIATAMHRVSSSRALGAVFVGARAGDLDAVERDVRALLRERHQRLGLERPDDFEIQNQARILAAQRKAAQSLTLFTSGLAAVALVVGGTGILALMLLSVRERTSEIGLRLAVGARPSDVLVQFLTEALVIALAGGLVGTAVGALGTWGVASSTGWTLRVSSDVAGMALAMSAAVGFTFGALPAWMAARLPPLRALAQP